MEAILLRAVSTSPLPPLHPWRGEQVANRRHLSSSFGMVNPKAIGESCATETVLSSQTPREPSTLQVDPTGDRAARLRSSDALKQKAKPTASEIPDAKNQDVVAVQLRLF